MSNVIDFTEKLLQRIGKALDDCDPEEVAKLARVHTTEIVEKMLSILRDPTATEEMKDECAALIVDVVAKMQALIAEHDQG